jgi:hypothetical protein
MEDYRRVLAYDDLREFGINFTPAGIRWLIKEGRFPQSVRLGGHRVVWLRDEVIAWLDGKIAERDRAGVPVAKHGARPPSQSNKRGSASGGLQRRPMRSA